MFDGGFVAIHTSFASIPFRPAASQVEGNLQKDCYISHIFPKGKTIKAMLEKQTAHCHIRGGRAISNAPSACRKRA
ncbi:hypothetical protein FHL81_05140 [Agrobacterium tumefaciens]|nr:hypothetical protein FHL81_05140 [Agrobacterium tumefaciens]KAB0458731.1 hypothetical protein F7R04_18430 [Agrobacterium tumefaciens]